jgi:hypothetical protein
MWRFTTIVAKYYMHTVEMKKWGFMKNKVVEHIVKVSIEKVALIPHTHVTHGINDLNKTNHAWMVWSQQAQYDIQGPTSFHQTCLLHM